MILIKIIKIIKKKNITYHIRTASAVTNSNFKNQLFLIKKNKNNNQNNKINEKKKTNKTKK